MVGVVMEVAEAVEGAVEGAVGEFRWGWGWG